jgi:hypothetical protein
MSDNFYQTAWRHVPHINTRRLKVVKGKLDVADLKIYIVIFGDFEFRTF